MSKATRPFTPLNVAIMTASDTRTFDNDTSGDLIQERLESAGHKVVERKILADDIDDVRGLITRWVEETNVDTIITTGGTGLTQRDILPEVVEPMFTKTIPGFGELFRMLSYDDIGTSTIESRALAGVADGTLVFCLPGSTGACKLGMDRIILPQIDATTRPCNLVALLPRIRHE
ncbi:MAG: molybdenum cofactor biosynthesis protein B [Acidiferrobacterales bacterium]|jgi:molybdenum cofactor biosynthesis protein B|nr:molybdenum cofactor biosynthesis protein B [Acidiferrobacterales bacterium]